MLDRSQIRHYLYEAPGDELLAWGDRIRAETMGEEVFIRGIIEFSNNCTRKCAYCGISAGRNTTRRYRMEEDGILGVTKQLHRLQVKTLVLQSGEDPHFSTDRMVPLIRQIKSETGMAITLSMGELGRDDYFKLRDAGADRYLMRFEIADPDHFRALHPDSSLEQRLQEIVWIRESGMQMGTGFLIGVVPDREHLVQDIWLTQKLKPDMIGVGPYIRNEEDVTTFSRHPTCDDMDLVLRVIALLRITNPNANIPATTAMEAIHPKGRPLALKAGANVIMPNFTPEQFCRDYHLYPGKPVACASAGAVLEKYHRILRDLGRPVAETGSGHSTTDFSK